LEGRRFVPPRRPRGALIWLASKFARRPEDQRGWLSLFLFSNFYLLLLFLVMVGERLLRHALA
jgi:heme O synthase-like polyprenyltransferase